MLNQNDYQKIKELKQTHPEHYELIQKIADTALNCASIGCHDIKNHVAIISSYMQLLEMNDPAILENPYFKKINTNTKNLLSLLDNIAQYRYSYNNKELSVCSISEIIQNISGELKNQTSAINFKVTVTPDIDINNLYLSCHKEHITSAFMEIVKNSLESTLDTANPYICIYIVRENNDIQISFCDNGSGIDPAILPNVLNPFTTDKKNHSGLGLSTASNIIYQHGGNITINSSSMCSDTLQIDGAEYSTIVNVSLPLKFE